MARNVQLELARIHSKLDSIEENMKIGINFLGDKGFNVCDTVLLFIIAVNTCAI